MLRIGEAAKQFDVSNRTLRYWEESGILKSTRMENGYRFYDDINSARIRQIVLLRKLKIPISEIERIFITADCGVTIDAMTGHLKNLERDSCGYRALISIVEGLIRCIKESQSLERMFSYLETQNADEHSVHETASQIKLSERTVYMSTERLDNVRVVRIPAMTVAAYRAEREKPEDDCGRVFNRFVLEYGLHKKADIVSLVSIIPVRPREIPPTVMKCG